MKVKDIGEFGLIERISRIVEHADERVIVTIGDDTAVVRPTELDYVLLTTDLLVEDIHFTIDTIKPRQLGYKSIAVNMSDIAAMGGIPDYAVISLAVNPDTEVDFIEDLYEGMADIARKYGVRIVGGDVTKSEKLVINVALVGEVEEEKLCRRSDAEVGDVIFVTGELGASAAGLRIILKPALERSVREAGALKEAHFLPEPQVDAGRHLALLGIHAMEDVSDGLASEIGHICEASSVGARIILSKIPVARGVEKVAKLTGESAMEIAAMGGEDYELVFTAPMNLVDAIESEMAKIGVTVTAIGYIVDISEGVKAIDWAGKEKPIDNMGYTHF